MRESVCATTRLVRVSAVAMCLTAAPLVFEACTGSAVSNDPAAEPGQDADVTVPAVVDASGDVPPEPDVSEDPPAIDSAATDTVADDSTTASDVRAVDEGVADADVADSDSENDALHQDADTDPDIVDADRDSTGDDVVEPHLDWTGPLATYGGCAADDPEAKLLSLIGPEDVVTAGAAVAGEVVYANCSTQRWIAAGDDSAPSGVKLGMVTDTVMHAWGRSRTALPASVEPGQAVRIAWTGVAPLTNGTHPWQVQLVDEFVRWLGEPSEPWLVEVRDGFGPFEVHTRDEWETAAYPVDGPAMDLLALEYITIHYNGGNADLDGPDDVYTDEDTIAGLRGSQRDYEDNRGYSLGYNSQIAVDGDEWEIRGRAFRSAANGCTAVNRPAYAIILRTATPETPPLPAQIEGARAAIARIRRDAAAAGNPNHLIINGHGDVRPLCGGGGTLCPGEPLRGLIASGALEP